MRKIYYLRTCSTCKRIIKDLSLTGRLDMQDIKESNIEPEVLDMLRSRLGSYELLFNKRAMKYRALGLNEQSLSEADYRKLILEEYTFLKRPVIIYDHHVFAGNSKKTVEAANLELNG